MRTLADEYAEEIINLRAELAAAQRDAERYRWLRQDKVGMDVYAAERLHNEWIFGAELDSMIDKALAAKGGV